MNIEACQLANFKPLSTVPRLIFDIQVWLAIVPKVQPDLPNDAHFVDERYKGQRGKDIHLRNFNFFVYQEEKASPTTAPKRSVSTRCAETARCVSPTRQCTMTANETTKYL